MKNETKAIMQAVIKEKGKAKTINALACLAELKGWSKQNGMDNFVEYAVDYVKSISAAKKPSGYSVKCYDDKAELVTKYIEWFAGSDINEQRTCKA